MTRVQRGVSSAALEKLYHGYLVPLYLYNLNISLMVSTNQLNMFLLLNDILLLGREDHTRGE